MLKKFKMEEIWKDIPEYEGLYQVSNLGRVKSLPKEWIVGKGTIRRHNGKILKSYAKPYGYLQVCLSKNKIKKSSSKTYSVHQLVAIAFLDHNPKGNELVIDHINNNKLDNRVENLQIVTHRYNVYKTQGKYSSQYKGVCVCLYKGRKKWRAQIKISGKRTHLGYFTDEYEAHLAYQNALKQHEYERLD
jgi:hypothetical protein